MNELAALFLRFDWYSLLDVAIVAAIIFGMLYLVRGTQAAPLLRGVITLIALAVAGGAPGTGSGIGGH